MDPFVRLGSLAVVIGLVGGMGLIKGEEEESLVTASFCECFTT
jgi:hypothetical protein